MSDQLSASRKERRDLLLEVLVLGLLALALASWFAGWPGGLPAWAPLGGAAAAALGRFGPPRRLPRLAPESLACLALAAAYRLPALLHAWGWVNRDGAYGAFVAHHVLQGLRPAPVFTEGANYQGTLKGHLAALLSVLTRASDLSFLMVLASVLLYLVFVASSMALARRLGGRPAAVMTGLYLAVAPKFLTVFSLNCVGQYVDVLALGGLALALLARLLEDSPLPGGERPTVLLIGVLLGAAFWQQPVALCYSAVVVLVLLLRPASWRSGALAWAVVAFALGALPVLLWNVQNDWGSGDILGRGASELRAQAEALPRLVRRTVTISFPILAGLAQGHPWSENAMAQALVLLIVPGAFLGHLVLQGRRMAASLREGRPAPALLPPLLALASLALFWATASGRVYWRPRYLLPLYAPLAIQLGVVLAWLWSRQRAAAAVVVGALLALHVEGTRDRFRDGPLSTEFQRQVVRSLEEKGIRTGYADFSISAPVTMFTGERIVLSPRLGPTPAYESERHARKVAQEGPDAFVLRLDEDPEPFAAALRSLGVTFRLDPDPVPVFYDLSRRVRIEEVAGFRKPNELNAEHEETAEID